MAGDKMDFLLALSPRWPDTCIHILYAVAWRDDARLKTLGSRYLNTWRAMKGHQYRITHSVDARS